MRLSLSQLLTMKHIKCSYRLDGAITTKYHKALAMMSLAIVAEGCGREIGLPLLEVLLTIAKMLYCKLRSSGQKGIK